MAPGEQRVEVLGRLVVGQLLQLLLRDEPALDQHVGQVLLVGLRVQRLAQRIRFEQAGLDQALSESAPVLAAEREILHVAVPHVERALAEWMVQPQDADHLRHRDGLEHLLESDLLQVAAHRHFLVAVRQERVVGARECAVVGG